MKTEQAIDYLKNTAKHRARFGETTEFYERAVADMYEVQRYREIGTVKEFKKLKSMIISTKPVYEAVKNSSLIKVMTGNDDKIIIRCPNCDNEIEENQKICDECGQAIDWQ